MSSSAATAARWSRRWAVSSSSNNRFLRRPLSRSSGCFGHSSSSSSPTLKSFTSLTHSFTQPAPATASSSSTCWFSSDASASSASKSKPSWSANIKRSKPVVKALEQLPSNLRFDFRSTCIPLSIDLFDKTNAAAASEAFDGSLDGEEEDDADTVIRPSRRVSTSSKSTASTPSSTSTKHRTSQPLKPFVAAPSGLVAIPLPQRLHVSVQDILDKSHPVGTIWLPAHIFGRDPIRVDLIKRAVEYQRNRQRGKRKAITKTISMVSGSGKKMRAQKRTGYARAGHKRPPHWRGGAVAHGPKGKIQDYGDTKLNVKVRQLAVQHVLSQKLKEQNLIVVDQLQDKLLSHQTKGLAGLLKKWNIGGRYGKSALILDVIEEQQVDQVQEGEDEDDEERDEREDDQEAFAATDASALTVTTADGTTILYRPKPQHIQKGGGLPLKLQVASGNIPHVEAENAWYANVYNILKYEKLILTLAALEVLEKRFASTRY